MRRLVIGFIGVCLFVALWEITQLWVEMRTLSWREVPARVIASDVKVIANTASITRRTQPIDRRWYSWDLQYAYRIDGLDYTAGRVRLVDTPVLTKDAALAMAAQYPIGAKVSARVSPDDPGFALLMPGPSLGSLALLFFALLTASGSIWVLRGLRPPRVRRR